MLFLGSSPADRRAPPAPRGLRDETNLPAEQSEAETRPRLPRTHAHAWRAQGDQRTPGQGPGTADGLTPAPPATPAGFPKRARLLTRRDFDRVFGRATRSVDDCFTVLARPNDAGGPRLGLAIARKHARAAVARNRVKRLVRESFRHHQGELGPLDIVVLGRQGLAKRGNVELIASLARHWKRLHEKCKASCSC